MPRIPLHEKNMLNDLDRQLTTDIAVWRIVKNDWFDKVKSLKESFDAIVDTMGQRGALPIEGDDGLRLRGDLFDLLNQYHSGNDYEYTGYHRRFFQNYREVHKNIFDNILDVTLDERQALPRLDLPWSTILEKGGDYPFKSFRTYIGWLWNRAISDAVFTPNLSSAMNEEQKNYWNSHDSILNDKVKPEIAENIINDWNRMTDANLAIGSCIEGFYFDGDQNTTIIEGKTMENFHIIAIPKQIDEAMFDTTMEYVKSFILKKKIPIDTVKDIYAHYLPINLRSETYRRQVIKNKSMVSMLFTGMFCDRLYETKIVRWRRENNKEIKTLHDAAECVAKLFSDLGFKYETDSVVNARKKFLKILKELKVN